MSDGSRHDHFRQQQAWMAEANPHAGAAQTEEAKRILSGQTAASVRGGRR